VAFLRVFILLSHLPALIVFSIRHFCVCALGVFSFNSTGGR
jgi:hypothetical protein